MLQLDSGRAKTGNALLQKLERQVGLFERELFADALNKDGIVGGYAEAVALEQLAVDAQVKGLRESAQEVVGGRAQIGIARAQVQESYVEQRARDVLGSYLGVHGRERRRLGLCKLPARAYVYDSLHDVLAVVVYETERTRLVRDGHRELIVVHEADLFDFGRVVDVVEQDLFWLR